MSDKVDVSKSWFCVLNNPDKHGFKGTPAEIVGDFMSIWITDNPQRSCAVAYCISADGLHHLHAVLEDVTAMRFSKVKKMYPSMHIEGTKGNKDQAEKYINKMPPYDEAGEQVIFTNRHGEIKGKQGQRRDLDIIEELLNQNMTPDEILDMSLSYRRYEKFVRDAYYSKRMKETPIKRDIKVYWHWGEPGTGKSHTYVQLSAEHGEQNIYFVGEYQNPFDNYNGQPILILDEFRGQIRYDKLLTLLGGYKVQVQARYTNAYSLWNEVHITTVFSPEVMYKEMVHDMRNIDNISQLMRRITSIIYHYKDDAGKYQAYETPVANYEDGKKQKFLAHCQVPDEMLTLLFEETRSPFI